MLGLTYLSLLTIAWRRYELAIDSRAHSSLCHKFAVPPSPLRPPFTVSVEDVLVLLGRRSADRLPQKQA
jgi:hypothetical protein